MAFDKPEKLGKPGRPSRPSAGPKPSSAARSARAATGPRGASTHEIRIIGGQWRRSRIKVLDKPGLRPTPDRVRETLFNWLGQDLTGWRCLDAFAGTGALGLEAASRGAQNVVLVEQDAALVKQLQLQCSQLGATAVRVQRGDGLAALSQAAPQSLDLILIDPPFDADLFAAALRAAAPGLADGGFVYLEAPSEWTDDALRDLGLMRWRHVRAGAVHAHLLQRPPAAMHF